MAFTQSGSVEVKRIKGKGRGVFARRPIRKGELIEKVPMLVLPAEEYHDSLGGTSLANYCFNWQEGTVALALGYGSLYNHSPKPNLEYVQDDPQTVTFLASRTIEPGDELTIDYGEEWWSTRNKEPD